MTVKEYNQLRETLKHIPENKKTKRQKQQSQELWAESMVESIVTYSYCVETHGRCAEKLLAQQKESYYNYLEDFEKKLGTKKLLKIIQDVLDDYERVVHGVFEDSEGNVYHGLQFKSMRPGEV